MISIGPFSVQTVVVALAVFVAWIVSRLLARRLPAPASRAAGALTLDAVLFGLITARVIFILIWWSDYAARPLAMLAIGDGGFHGPAGVLAGALWLWWKTRRRQALRRAVYGGLASGVLLWGSLQAVPAVLQQVALVLPQLQLEDLETGQPVALDGFTGQPVVLNLWATWCPPCRREMPVLMQAQANYPDVAFVLVNQGESAQQVRAFLEAEKLALEYLLLDPFSSALRDTGSRGLPTTLFFDEHGRMVSSHVGELTTPALKNTLQRYFPALQKASQKPPHRSSHTSPQASPPISPNPPTSEQE